MQIGAHLFNGVHLQPDAGSDASQVEDLYAEQSPSNMEDGHDARSGVSPHFQFDALPRLGSGRPHDGRLYRLQAP